APYTYGLPSWALATFTAVAAPAFTAGAGPLGAGGGEDGLGAEVTGGDAGWAVVGGDAGRAAVPAGAGAGPEAAGLLGAFGAVVGVEAAGAASVLNFCWPCCSAFWARAAEAWATSGAMSPCTWFIVDC